MGTQYDIDRPVLRTHRRAAKPELYDTEPIPRQKKKYHWLTPVGAGMLAMFFIILFVFGIVAPWLQVAEHRWNCGQGNVCFYQYNIFHAGDEFISVAANNRVDVFYMPGGDASHTKVYTLSDPGARPGQYIELAAADVLGSGRKDIVVSVSGESLPHTLFNTGDGFKWDTP